MSFSFAGALVAVVLLAATPVAGQAGSSYKGAYYQGAYQGRPFTTAFPPYTTAMSISGSFAVGANLPPNSTIDISGSLLHFSFFDGIETRNETNSLVCQFEVDTNSSGTVISGNIWLRESGGADPQHSLEIRDSSDLAGFLSPNNGCGSGALNPFASVTGQPGVWNGQGGLLEVPALSGVGLALLTALLIGCALWRLRHAAFQKST